MPNKFSQRPARQARRTNLARDLARRPVWFFVVLFLAITGLSLISLPGVSWANFGTLPPGATVPPTVLVGPVNADGLDGDPRTITVAGIPVILSEDTRIDERVAPLTQAGVWARVEGFGTSDAGGAGTIPDETAGLVAVRIKVLPPMPLVRLTGPLDELTPLNEAGVGSVAVDGIGVFTTITTLIVGNPQPQVDRVHVRAAIQTNGTLLAIQVVKIGHVPDEDDDDDDDDGGDDQGRVWLTGRITQEPVGDAATGTWLVSGIAVIVNDETRIHDRVGPLIQDAWVKVRGRGVEGAIVADEIKTTPTKHFHKLKGTLTAPLVDHATEIEVSGITVDLSETASIRGNPQVGHRVVVKGQLNEATNTFVAVLVERRGHGGGGGEPAPPGLVVRFTGEVQKLPENGLYGAWQIAGQNVTVPEGAFIDEHKASVAQGAFVEVTAIMGNGQSLTAVLIVVTRPGSDDDDDDDSEWVEFRATVNTLPVGNGLQGDWLVGDKTVHVGQQTEIRDRGQGIKQGDKVKVRGWLEADGSVRAVKIELLEDARPPVYFIGAITALPANLQDGVWEVDGRQVQVDGATELNSEHGEFVVGRQVKVYGREQDGGPVLAIKIYALPPPEIRYTGSIISTPQGFPDQLVGDWTIGEKAVVTTGETEFKQENGPLTVGGLVKVKGRLESDGSITAFRIETMPLPFIEHIGEITKLPDTAGNTIQSLDNGGGDNGDDGDGGGNNGQYLGLWEIGNLTFLVTEETELDSQHGDFALGVVVKAKGRLRGDGVVIAEEIETKWSRP